MKQLCTTGRWKIVFDETYTSAKKVKAAVRDEHFRGKGKDAKGKKAQDPRKLKDKEEKNSERIKKILGKTREATEYFTME